MHDNFTTSCVCFLSSGSGSSGVFYNQNETVVTNWKEVKVTDKTLTNNSRIASKLHFHSNLVKVQKNPF